MTKLINYYYNYFLNNNNRYLLLKSCVCLSICEGLYKKFMADGLPPIESLDEVERELYLEKATDCYEDFFKIESATKAAYVLNLITAI